MKFLKKLIADYNKLNKRRKAYLTILLILVFIMVWAFLYAGVVTCNFNRAQIKNGVNDQNINAGGIIITETKKGTKYFELYGEKGNYNNQDKIAILYNVIGNFFKEGEVSMSFQSSKGSYNEKTGVITLYNNTYIVIKDNTSLEADKLIWSGSDKDVIAEGNVKIKRGKDMIAIAKKCIISANYDKFKIIGETKTQIFGKDKGM